MKSIIGLDLDGVILDHTKNKLALAKQFGVAVSDPKETASDIFKEKFSDNAYDKLQKLLYDDPRMVSQTELLPGAKDGLMSLVSANFSVALISRRRSNATAIELLKKFGLWGKYFNEKNVFFVESKKDKDVRAQALGVKTYIDDQPSVLAELISVPERFLLDPFQAHGEFATQFNLVSSWPEFIERVC
jgi:hypothetical protein